MSKEHEIITRLVDGELETRLARDHQSVLQNGDVLIGYKLPSYLSGDIVSNAIIRVTNSYATHAAFYLDTQLAHARIMKRAVVTEPLYDKRHDLFLSLRPNITSAESEALTYAIKKYVGKEERLRKYDFTGLIGYFFYQKFNWKHNTFASKQSYFCSEFIDVCFKKAGIALTHKKKSEDVSPKDLLESDLLTFQYVIDGNVAGEQHRDATDSIRHIRAELKKILKNDSIRI